jgi:hypothetical protein
MHVQIGSAALVTYTSDLSVEESLGIDSLGLVGRVVHVAEQN